MKRTYEFFEEIPTGDTAVPPAAEAQPVVPPVKEDVTNPGDTPAEQNVPLSRFQEVNNKAKEYEAEIARLTAERDTPKPLVPPVDDEAAAARAELEKLGYLTADQVEARLEARMNADRAARGYEADMTDLKSKYKDFDRDKVEAHLKATVGTVKSKDAIEAAYFYLNRDSIMENVKKAAIDEAASGGKGSAEKPGAGGAKVPAEQTPKAASGDFDWKGAIRTAKANLQGPN